MSRKRSLFRRVVRGIARRYEANQKAKKAAEKRRERAQKAILRQSRTTAGELVRSGDYEWSGPALPDSTKVEPVMGPNGWEFVPVAGASRTRPKAAGSSPAGAKLCGARTKNGTACKRRGKCPDHPQKGS